MATWEIRRRIVIALVTAGFFTWAGEAFLAWGTSLEPKFEDAPYLGSTAADEVLALAALAFATVAILLAIGLVQLARRSRPGRVTVIVACTLVLLGQTLALVLVTIPIDAFYYHAPPGTTFCFPLMIFPLLTIALLLGVPREN
ncbi:hypothetical protein JMUB6875_59730 [Nocardia sp. JMUB6875]